MELMVVIAIISIMSAISIPMLLNPDNNVRKAARELMGDMQKTKMSAIRANESWSIVFNTAANTYQIFSGAGVLQKTVDLNSSAPGVRFGNGVAVNPIGATFSGGVSYTGDTLSFNPRGTGDAGYVYLFYRDSTYAIGTRSTGGLVRIQRWTGGAWR